MKQKIKKNDLVVITMGKDKGRSGRVLEVDRQRGRVVVEGLNLVKKTVRPKKQNEKGGITEVEAPIRISNVMVSCKKCGRTRVGFKSENGKKTRVCRKCGELLQ